MPFEQKYQHILNGGDDYQLCLTMNQDNFDEFNRLYPNLIYPIGHIVADKGLVFLHNKKEVDLLVKGWEHF